MYGIIAFTLTILCALSSSAQTFRGGINGTVTDHTGAAIANATVTAIQTDTGVAHNTVSSSAGDISLPGSSPRQLQRHRHLSPDSRP